IEMTEASLIEEGKLASHRVSNAPPTVFYIRDFVSEEEEEALLNEVDMAHKPKWEVLLNRRLMNYGGVVGKKSLFAVDDFPPFLRSVMNRVNEYLDRPINHALINEYLPGQGIMPHTDGPAFLPVIITVTLGSHTVLDLYDPVNPNSASSELDRRRGGILLERRSLVIITQSMYKEMLHGISEKREDVIDDTIWNGDEFHGQILQRQRRISLTLRVVDKVNTRVTSLLGGRV
ncbi:hypothetical protein PFISCL1PPCAC_15688, partial [Pristionchus fissidentatus]